MNLFNLWVILVKLSSHSWVILTANLLSFAGAAACKPPCCAIKGKLLLWLQRSKGFWCWGLLAYDFRDLVNDHPPYANEVLSSNYTLTNHVTSWGINLWDNPRSNQHHIFSHVTSMKNSCAILKKKINLVKLLTMTHHFILHHKCPQSTKLSQIKR